MVPSPPQPARTDGRTTVLYVDDEPRFGDLITEFLTREDDRFDVLTETAASEAIDRLTERSVDCIVSDYDMPGMDGLEFLDVVREEYPELPFILYTSKGSEEIASEAITKGATGYLQKQPGTSQYELLANRISNAVEKYRARTQLRRRKDQYQWLFEHAPVMFAMYRIDDGEPRLEEANRQFYEKLGHDPEDLTGESITVIYTEEAARAAMEGGGVERSLSGEFGTEERTLVTADGDRLDTLNRCVPRLDESGTVTGLLTLYLDVTERREYERERTLFRTLVDHAIDEMYVIEPDTGQFVAVNDTACDRLGYDRDRLLELSVHDIDATGLTEGWTSSDFVHAEEMQRQDGKHQRADGTTYPVEVAGAYVELDQYGGYLFAVARDVSDRRGHD